MGKGMKAGKKKKPGGGANMQKQLAQMQKVQQQMDEVQTEIEQMDTTATSGGGAVSVKVTGSKQVKEITIDKDVVDPDDVEMLQDLVMTAVNEALRQMDEIAESEMSKVTGGLNIPGF